MLKYSCLVKIIDVFNKFNKIEPKQIIRINRSVKIIDYCFQNQFGIYQEDAILLRF